MFRLSRKVITYGFSRLVLTLTTRINYIDRCSTFGKPLKPTIDVNGWSEGLRFAKKVLHILIYIYTKCEGVGRIDSQVPIKDLLSYNIKSEVDALSQEKG